MLLVACGAVLGALDDVTGNHLGLGRMFEEGFLCMGQTALSMAGILCIIPMAGTLLAPVLIPAAHVLGFDPAMFGALLANNMGGYPLAVQLAENEEIGRFAGLIVSSTLGATLVYTIPVGLGMLESGRHRAFARGILLGIIPIPVGAMAGGLMMGLGAGECVVNLLPVMETALLIVWGFMCHERRLFAFFTGFSRALNAVALLSLSLAAFQYISGWRVVPMMDDIMSVMEVVVDMSIFQLGSIPMAALFTRLLRKPLSWLAGRAGISARAMAALPITCVNAISAFAMMKEMDEKGITVVSAFLTGSICVCTAHLSYTLSMDAALTGPVAASKLLSGFLALLLALAVSGKGGNTSEAA